MRPVLIFETYSFGCTLRDVAFTVGRTEEKLRSIRLTSRTWWDPLFSLLSEPGTLSLPISTRSPLFSLYLFSLSERGRRRRAQSGSDPPPAERRRPFLLELAAGGGAARRGGAELSGAVGQTQRAAQHAPWASPAAATQALSPGGGTTTRRRGGRVARR